MASNFNSTINAAVFDRLYEENIEAIYNFLFYKTLNRETAADLAQEVFLKAWRGLKKNNVENPKAWLYTISRHAIADYYKRLKPQANIDDFWDLADSVNLLEKLDQKMAGEKIIHALKKLSSSDRDLLIMRFWLDLPFAEIATHLEKNEGAVKMACSRALKKIQTEAPFIYFLLLAGQISNL
ncbi:RNA polymerase sigma factor [Candidatus Falkowbacteria bacterium]|nr:RNA polymerase sigma factor [Candidatus Falkowbacteria bacterium]